MRIYITATAEKRMKSLPGDYWRLLDAKIRALPSGDVRKLKGGTGQYRLRVGSYRVLFTMDEAGIVITDVAHRKDAY